MGKYFQVTQAGLKLIEAFEGFRSERYLDSVGVPTIGYGTTAAVVDPLPETCTQQEAEKWLETYLNNSVIPAIQAADTQRYVKIGHYFNQNQVNALASLGYNLGSGIFDDTHTIGYDIRHGALAGKVSQDFLLYEDAGGHTLAGLVTRREAERALFDRKVKNG